LAPTKQCPTSFNLLCCDNAFPVNYISSFLVRSFSPPLSLSNFSEESFFPTLFAHRNVSCFSGYPLPVHPPAPDGPTLREAHVFSFFLPFSLPNKSPTRRHDATPALIGLLRFFSLPSSTNPASSNALRGPPFFPPSCLPQLASSRSCFFITPGSPCPLIRLSKVYHSLPPPTGESNLCLNPFFFFFLPPSLTGCQRSYCLQSWRISLSIHFQQLEPSLFPPPFS